MRPLPELALPKGVPRDRLVYAAMLYMIVWLALWYSAKLFDVFGGVSLWFLPAGLRFFSYMLLGWPAVALELMVVLIPSLLQFMTSGLPAPDLLSAQMGWLVYGWFTAGVRCPSSTPSCYCPCAGKSVANSILFALRTAFCSSSRHWWQAHWAPWLAHLILFP